MELKEEKILGGIGAILTLFFIIPFIGWVISLVGLILIAISIYKMGKKFNEKNLFSNYLLSIIFFFLSQVSIVLGLIFAYIKGFFKNIEIFNFDFQNRFFDGEKFFRKRPFGYPFNRDLPDFKNLLNLIHDRLWIILLVLLIVWVLIILGGIFKKKSFDILSLKTKIENFKLSGLLVLIGTILVPIFGIGFILILIGIIFEIIGFFSIPEKIEEVS
jgi:uncharacterized membrane protein